MAATRTKTAQQGHALREQIYSYYCAGQSQTAIAKALGLNQTAISYHVRKAREAHRVEAESRRADRLAELDRVRAEAWEAWEGDRSPLGTAFLNQIQKAISQERSLLGLDASRTATATLHISELPNDTKDLIVGGLQES